MPLNPIPVGDAIATFVQSIKPPDGTPVTDALLKQLWEGIVTIIYNDLKANAEVEPGTFNAPSGGGPITGLGGPLL